MKAKLLILFLCQIFVWNLFSQESEVKSENITSLFNHIYESADSLPVLNIKTDWKNFLYHKLDEEYQPAEVELKIIGEADRVFTTKLRSRGNARKKICFQPPLKIKFKKDQLEEMGFSKENKIKLVIPCDKTKRSEEYLLREYLIYKMYELVSPIHMRTRLIRLTIDYGSSKILSFLAFIVENESHFEQRLDAKILTAGVINSSKLHREIYVNMCFFQYMISNTDWAVANRHNLEIASIKSFDKLVTVPYDFDYAGFCGTDYAVPGENIPIADVHERYFRGVYVTEEEAMKARSFFLNNKEIIISTCNNFSYVDMKKRKFYLKYLNEFFDLVESEKFVKKNFITSKFH